MCQGIMNNQKLVQHEAYFMFKYERYQVICCVGTCREEQQGNMCQGRMNNQKLATSQRLNVRAHISRHVSSSQWRAAQ